MQRRRKMEYSTGRLDIIAWLGGVESAGLGTLLVRCQTGTQAGAVTVVTARSLAIHYYWQADSLYLFRSLTGIASGTSDRPIFQVIDLLRTRSTIPYSSAWSPSRTTSEL